MTGATLENGLKLKKANLRGVESDGMMMSEQELGYEEKSPGIVDPAAGLAGRRAAAGLPAGQRGGPRARAHPQPAGLLQHLRRRPRGRGGVRAGAGAAAHRRSRRLRAAPPRPSRSPSRSSTPTCARATRRGSSAASSIGESPAWLKARLTHAGMRPISNVVDVTNYVMFGWGQPLHAFDAGKIEGDKLITRRARDGEKIVTLDGVERTLDGEMLVIADVARPLVIAGVFGAVDAEVDAQTTDLVLEAANFSGPSILRTELHTGIRSEASNRFEKGLDAALVPGGLAFATRLFEELCGGIVAPGTVDVAAEQPAPRKLPFRPAKADALLGYAVPAAEQAAIMRRLECEVDEADPSASASSAGRPGPSTAEWTVTPPSFRPDLVREVDLIEEVGRISGYDRATETLPRHRTAGGLTGPQQVRRAVRRALTGCGLDEVITYSFVAPDSLAPLGLPEGDVRLRPVRLSNPMSVEQSVMRTMLLPGLLGAVRDNLSRLNEPPSIFELGKVYLWDDEVVAAPAHAAEPGAVLPHEPEALAIVIAGPLQAESWTAAPRPADFFALKGVVEAALGALRLEAGFAALGESAVHFPYLHPGKSATVTVPKAGGVGVAGMLRPDVAAAYGVEDVEVFVAMLALDRIAAVALPTPAFEDLGSYPPASQDLAVVVGRDASGRWRRRGRAPCRRQAGAQRARLRRLRGRPGGCRQALARPASRDALVRAHAGREGHRDRARQDPRRARARVRGDAALTRAAREPVPRAGQPGAAAPPALARAPRSRRLPHPALRRRITLVPTRPRRAPGVLMTPTTCAQTFKTGSSLPAACDPCITDLGIVGGSGYAGALLAELLLRSVRRTARRRRWSSASSTTTPG